VRWRCSATSSPVCPSSSSSEHKTPYLPVADRTAFPVLNLLRRYALPVSVASGVGTFASLCFLLAALSGPPRCRDGWLSPSIGHRGACSWHGGVDRSGDGRALLLPFGALSWFIGFYVFDALDRGFLRDRGERKGSLTPEPGGDEASSSDESAHLSDDRAEIRTPVADRSREGRRAATSPSCPACGSPMRIRTAKKGPRTGRPFYGCANFPRCRGTRPFRGRAKR